MKWETVKLAALYEVHNGLSKGRESFGTGFPFLTFSTVFNNYFIPDELDSLVQSTEKEQQDYSIKRGDVFVTRTSETSDELGMSCVALKDYPHATYNGFTKRMRPVGDRVVPEYIGYYMRMPSFRNQFQAFSTMTTRASLKNEDLLSLEINLPDIAKQKRIAGILMAYDSLIENNQKQIKLLEEAAQRLYKEWFIDLRFPSHESTPIHDGIPEGWERKPIGALISYEIGGGWGDEEPSNSADHGAFVIRGTDLYGLTHGSLTEIPFRYHGTNNLTARALKDGDIVFEVSGGSRTEGVARTALIRKDMLDRWNNPVMCASFCKLIRPITPEYSQYLFDHFQYLRASGKTEEYDKRSASSIVNYRWKDFLSQETMLKPSKPIIDLYNQNAATIYKAIIEKSLQIETAQNARDRLLPRLMSGEIEV